MPFPYMVTVSYWETAVDNRLLRTRLCGFTGRLVLVRAGTARRTPTRCPSFIVKRHYLAPAVYTAHDPRLNMARFYLTLQLFGLEDSPDKVAH